MCAHECQHSDNGHGLDVAHDDIPGHRLEKDPFGND